MEECESVTEVGLNVDSKHHKNVKVQGFCNSQMPLIEKISPECHPILAQWSNLQQLHPDRSKVEPVTGGQPPRHPQRTRNPRSWHWSVADGQLS